MSVSLNQNALEFIEEFEKIANKKTWTKSELVEKFVQSSFYNEQFESYHSTALEKSIWWAVKRNKNWEMNRSFYLIKAENGYDQGISKENKTFETACIDEAGSLVKTQGFGEGDINLKMIEELNHNEDVIEKGHSMISTISYNRDALIRHLSEHLFEVTMLSLSIRDEGLRDYQLKKGMGENLYFLTESYFRRLGLAKTKYRMGDFITLKAKERLLNQKPSLLVYEHMVPKNIYLNEIRRLALTNELTQEKVHNLLNKYHFICIVTKEEDRLLPSTTMPLDWDGDNPFYRYEETGIEFEPVQYFKTL